MVDPKLGEKILDPACGTGGFLTCAINNIRKNYVKSIEEDGIESNFPATYRTCETADLFLLLFMHLLKEGGRSAIVLPDGTLFGEGVKTRIKEKLLEECNLHTIVRLPNGVKSYNKTKPIRIEEFAPEKAWWQKREKNERAWKVSIDEIKAGGYNLDIKNPSVVNNAHRDPEELLAEYRKLLAGIAETRSALKNELKAALEVKNA
jgi:type I restriction enzyme M protein